MPLRLGKSQSLGRSAIHQARSVAKSCGDNLALRSLRPLPCSILSVMALLSIAIYSEPSLGTCVRLYLPTANGLQARQDETLAELREAPGGNETILVVEDDPFVRGYAVATLEGLGYKTLLAANGPEALSRLGSDAPIDMLFTDIVMPGGMNGWDLAQRAGELRPGIKVLFTSGYALDTLLANGRVLQGVLILMKPYRKSDLASRVRQALGS